MAQSELTPEQREALEIEKRNDAKRLADIAAAEELERTIAVDFEARKARGEQSKWDRYNLEAAQRAAHSQGREAPRTLEELR